MNKHAPAVWGWLREATYDDANAHLPAGQAWRAFKANRTLNGLPCDLTPGDFARLVIAAGYRPARLRNRAVFTGLNLVRRQR